MRRLIIIPLLVVALAGCAQIQKAYDVVTTTITNPVTSVDIYRVKNVYAATLQLAADYRAYCWSKPYAALMADVVSAPVCKNRRAVVRAMQAADAKASAAVNTADNFVRNNPTLNAASLVSAAWAAVTNFQSTVPSVK